MTFTFPALISVYLLPFLAAVVVIHLIHLLRHRRVRWAAMDFLLESKKKNQTSVRLKQLLLLLLRLAAVAAIAFLLAGPILQDAWSRLLGGSKVHHVILLDDSGSMADQGGNTAAFERGQQVMKSILSLARRGQAEQGVTLCTFSSVAAGRSPEIIRELAHRKTPEQWDEAVNRLAPTALGVGPLEAVEAVEKMILPEKNEKMILYILSDFRAAQWQESGALRQQFERLTANDIQLELIQCATGPHENLAITDLAPLPGPQVRGVAMRMRVEVTNYGQLPVKNVPVQLRQRSVTAENQTTPLSLGAVTLEKIEPGESVEGFFDIVFQYPGSHIVEATLSGDALPLDDRRWTVVEIAVGVPVLVIDDGGEDASLFLRLALAPSAQVSTGAQIQVERSTFLRDSALDRYHAIFLLNVSRLDEIEIERLEQYVRDGGGVVFFAGPQTDRNFVNRNLYREGEGFFPLPLASPATLLVDRLETVPDIEVDTEHPIFTRIFGGAVNNWLQAINVSRYYAASSEWNAADDSDVHVLAQLRNEAPWIIEKDFGAGKVLAVLSTAAPRWHNWGLADPSFVLWALDTLVYLGATKTEKTAHETGETLQVEAASTDFRPLVSFTAPGTDQTTRGETIQVAAVAKDDATKRMADFGVVDHPGVYEVRRSHLDGEVDLQCEAFNPPKIESDLGIIGEGQIGGLLRDIPYHYRSAETFIVAEESKAGFPLAEQWWFFILLAGILVVEQWVAYGASYHPSKKLPSGNSR